MLFKKLINGCPGLMLLTLLMTGCASISPVYVNKNPNVVYEINQVLIMVEYLELKDDIRKHWNFYEDLNLNQQDQLFDLAQQMLISKGYEVLPNSLKTSGLVVSRDYYVDHYIDRKRQSEVIAPPYIVRSVGLNDDDIYAMESILAALTQPMSDVMSEYRSFIYPNYKEYTDALNVSDDTAILVIHSYRPRSTFFSSIDVGFSISNSSSGVFAGANGAEQIAKSSAYLIHKGSGEVIWANHTGLIKPNTQLKFFAQLPINQ